MFLSSGTLKYSCNDEPKLIVAVDNELSRFYRSLVPKNVRIKPQRYPSHITVIRNEFFDKVRGNAYDSQIIEFKYSNIIMNDDVYYWLVVQCPKLKLIRKELGLPDSSELSRPPNGDDCFHITIGNIK